MGRLERELTEDRALRNAASSVFQADLTLLRARLAPNELANRVGHQIEEGGGQVAGRLSELARENRGALMAGLAAAGALATLFLARNPILAAFAKRHDPGAPSAEPNHASPRFQSEPSNCEQEGAS